MGFQRAEDSESRFAKFVEGLVSVIGHADRARPLWDYCVGLIMPCGRKSVEPMAAVTAPERVAAQHQSLLHFANQAPWSDEKVLAKVREMVVPALERHGPIEAWIIDDTGLPKKGRHSVGVGGNTAANWASRRTARWRCRCRSPITTPACRWPIAFICRRTGLRMANGVARRVCLKRSASRPSPRSRSSSCAGHARPALRVAWC